MRGGQQALHLLDGQDFGQARRPARTFEDRGRIIAARPLAIKEAMQLPNGRKPPGRGRRRKATGLQSAQIGLDVVRCGALQGLAGAGESALVIGEVAAVGFERIGGSAALGGQHVQKSCDAAVFRHAQPIG